MLTFENYGAQDQGTMHLLDLPVVMIEHVFSFLTYDEVAKNRIICKDFDSICQRMLNRGFLLIERRHALSLKAIKTQLPRRESERRFHAFAKHNDILTSIETRLSMLSMTYAKFIDQNVCCFIPGKVIDEIDRLLGIVEHSPVLPRAHEVLQELRDISSMAIEHFDDKISPELRQRMMGGKPFNAPAPDPNSAAASGADGNQPFSPDNGSELLCIRNRCFRNHRTILQLSKRYCRVFKRMKLYKRQLCNQNRHIKELSRRQADQDGNMAELKKRIEECDVKYQELTHSQVSGGKGIKDIAVSPALNCVSSSSNQSSSATLKNFSSQIKLDPSHLHMGPTRGRPNIRPRKASVDQPPNRELASLTSKARGQHGHGKMSPAASRSAVNRLAARGSKSETFLETLPTNTLRVYKKRNASECVVGDASIDNNVDRSLVNFSERSSRSKTDNLGSFVDCTNDNNSTAGPSSAFQKVTTGKCYSGHIKRRKSYESLYKAFSIIDEPSEADKSHMNAQRNSSGNISNDPILNFIARGQIALPPLNAADYNPRKNFLENLIPLIPDNVQKDGVDRPYHVKSVPTAICDEFVAVGNKLVAVSQLGAPGPSAGPIVDVDAPQNVDMFQKRKRVYSDGCIGCWNMDKIRLIRQCKICEKSNPELPGVDTKRHKS